MKRGGPKRDPAKTREWQDRSRAAARDREAKRRNDPTVRGEERSTRSPLGPGEFRPVRFRSHLVGNVRDERCVRCHAPAAHWHHWLEQQHLRVYVRGQRLDDRAAGRLLKSLLHDRRNISAVCVACHGNETTHHAQLLTFEHVPPSAFTFAYGLGREWGERLRRAYPSA